MQQNQQRRFADSSTEDVYRFPQNRQEQRKRAFAPIPAELNQSQAHPYSRKESTALKRPRKRRRIFTLWNLFAVFGIISSIVIIAKYVVIPLLVYLNVLAGGTL